jgi:hypothetical protein
VLLLVLCAPRAARADVFPEDAVACKHLKTGDPCDDEWSGVGFRGVCTPRKGARGRVYDQCLPLGLPSERQEACRNWDVGDECEIPSDPYGVCRTGEPHPVPGKGGVGTVNLVLTECQHDERIDKTRRRTGLALAAEALVVAAAVVVILRRRRQRTRS